MKAKEEKQPVNAELCAVPKSFVVEKLKELYEANKSVFEEYELWVKVLNSQVNVVGQEEPTIADTKE